ncbi:MAG: hypothetical protein ACRDRI_01180 [Pseudonocardiaceae bacterium]
MTRTCRNYAVPGDGVDPTPDQVAKLIAAFTDRDRTPRLEYLPALCPAVEPALLTRACLTVGITTPFLTPAGEAEERIYRRIGYRPVAEMLHISGCG